MVRVVWAGCVSKPGGDEADDKVREQYKMTLRTSKGAASDVVPFALADQNNCDNNHLLCLDAEGTPESVSFPAGFLADPRGDLNPNTRAAISKLFEGRSLLATGRCRHCLAWLRGVPSLSSPAAKPIRATAKRLHSSNRIAVPMTNMLPALAP